LNDILKLHASESITKSDKVLQTQIAALREER